MKISLMMAVRTHPKHPASPVEFYQDFLDDTVRAERLGFDYAWFGEHHFTADQWTPAPLLVIAAAAAMTSRIRLGTSVLCLPFHNPLRVAEDVAVLDILSNGRIDFGFGVGSQYEEFETFGIPPAERSGRTWEAIDLIERCWSEEQPFSHEGKYYRYPNIHFTTRPVQKKIPIWMGASGPQNVTKAAQRGYHLFARGNPLYDQELRASGYDPADFYCGSAPTLSLAETKEKAFDAIAEGQHYFVNFYRLRRQIDGTLPPPEAEISIDKLRSMNEANELSMFGTLIADTPEGALSRLQGYVQRINARGRLNHLPINFRTAGQKTEDVERSMELFAEKIMPHLV
jgi:alkanesulfonate monooxygenase SsuD/methylene tetrahydromethanopterin reductase-like flavin-dependent oxidoreductase (luciferase family)